MASMRKNCAGNFGLDKSRQGANAHAGLDDVVISSANVQFLEQLVAFCNSKKMNNGSEAPKESNGVLKDGKCDCNGFREKVNMYFGDYLPAEVVDELCKLVNENSYGKCKCCILPTESIVLSVLQILLDASKKADEETVIVAVKSEKSDIKNVHPNRDGSIEKISLKEGAERMIDVASKSAQNISGKKDSIHGGSIKRVEKEIPKCYKQQRCSVSCMRELDGNKGQSRTIAYCSGLEDNNICVDANQMPSDVQKCNSCDPLFGSLKRKPVIILDTPIVIKERNHGFDEFSSVPAKVPKKARRVTVSSQMDYQGISAAGNNCKLETKASPEVQVVGCSKFRDRCVQFGKLTDKVYNSRLSYSMPGKNFIDLTRGSVGEAVQHEPNLVCPAVFSPAKMNLVDVVPDGRFPLTAEEIAYYRIICGLAHSQWSCEKAVDINRTNVSYSSLGESVEPKGKVDNFFIAGFCRKLFYDQHPRHCKKHYFFPHVGGCLLTYNCSYDMRTIQKCFVGANSALKLHLSHKLCFPVFLSKHWFVFIVDLENKLFVFLDSYFSPVSNFQVEARGKLINSFKESWYQHAEGKINVDLFETAYPPVPKQQNVYDCGIFALKFMELWDNSIDLRDLFDHTDIPNLRVKMGVDLFFSTGNSVDKTLVRNLYEQGIDPIVCK